MSIGSVTCARSATSRSGSDTGSASASRVTSSGPSPAHARPHPTATRVIAIVSDLFFVARIRETARLAGVSLVFARSPEEIETALTDGARLVLLDLTGAFDYAAVFGPLERAPSRPPV